MWMNRKKAYKRLDNSKKELKKSLLMIKDAHDANELIVNKIQQAILNVSHASMYRDLKNDMELVNTQLNTILERLKDVNCTK